MANENKKVSQDVLAYNTIGAPLLMGVTYVSKESVVKAITAITRQYMQGEFRVVIDSWFDGPNYDYDELNKSNRKTIRNAFQVWIPESNSSISAGKDEGNVFFDGVTTFNENFKKFVNTFGMQGEKGALSMLGIKNKHIIVLLEPTRLFPFMFDEKRVKYNEDNPETKCNREVVVSTKALYDNEDPMPVIFGTAEHRKKQNLTGWIVMKYFAGINNDKLDTYRPPLNTKSKRKDGGKKYI